MRLCVSESFYFSHCFIAFFLPSVIFAIDNNDKASLDSNGSSSSSNLCIDLLVEK